MHPYLIKITKLSRSLVLHGQAVAFPKIPIRKPDVQWLSFWASSMKAICRGCSNFTALVNSLPGKVIYFDNHFRFRASVMYNVTINLIAT